MTYIQLVSYYVVSQLLFFCFESFVYKSFLVTHSPMNFNLFSFFTLISDIILSFGSSNGSHGRVPLHAQSQFLGVWFDSMYLYWQCFRIMKYLIVIIIFRAFILVLYLDIQYQTFSIYALVIGHFHDACCLVFKTFNFCMLA